MNRTRASAKAAGTRLETVAAGYLAKVLRLPIERRARNGAKDRGDLAGVTDSHGRRIVVECKDYGGRLEPSPWLHEAEREREHDDAYVGLVIAKRRAHARPADQYVILTLGDLAKLLTPPTNTPQE